MKQITAIALLLMCSSFGYAQRNNNNHKQQTTVSKPKPKPSSGTQSSKPVEVYYDSNQKAIVYGNSTYKMLFVGGGIFTMGNYNGIVRTNGDIVCHRVALSSYCLGQTEVPQGLWKAVMGNNPSTFKGDNLPVENVSWNDCQVFLSKLNSLTGKEFCLPTEAEWEFAAVGGNLHTKNTSFSGNDDAEVVAWCNKNSNNKTHQVATKQCNELYFFDMSGNVWEWCQDWDGAHTNKQAVTNPFGAEYGNERVTRGSSYMWGGFVRGRSSSLPSYKSKDVGLRICLHSDEGFELGRQSYINTNNYNYRRYDEGYAFLQANIGILKIKAVNLFTEGKYKGWQPLDSGEIILDEDYLSVEIKTDNPMLLRICDNVQPTSTTDKDGTQINTYMAESTDGSNVKVKISTYIYKSGERYFLMQYSDEEAILFEYTKVK